MKKVVKAMDYGPTAQKVAEAGHALAKAMNAEVYLMHVISDPVYYSSTAYSPIMGFSGYVDLDPLRNDFMKSLLQSSQDFLTQTKNHLFDQSIHTLVKEGETADSILESAKELSADIIVMGSHSRKWLEKIVMGSVTEKVLNQTSIPLFIVPTKKES